MSSKLTEDIISWNLRFPYDRIWRKKYSVAFNSSGHRGISFLDQVLDIEEDNLFEELISEEEYSPNTGDWLKPQGGKTQLDSIESLREEFKDLKDDE